MKLSSEAALTQCRNWACATSGSQFTCAIVIGFKAIASLLLKDTLVTVEG
jgi:hypothetical protein